MTKIIAIGWGEIRAQETRAIDQEIIHFSGKKNPKLLFIPTANEDSQWYFTVIKTYFEHTFGCKVDVLYLIHTTISPKEIEKKILETDIIYIGGGNTLKMMTIWRKLGIDKLLEKARKKDIVLCGLSAGSICRFDSGNSDSRKFTSKSTQLIKVKWLWYIHALHCPHYDIEPFRQDDLKRMMHKTPGVSIAIENCCALEIHNDTYRVITSKPWAKAYKVYRKRGEYFQIVIPQKDEFMPIKPLLEK